MKVSDLVKELNLTVFCGEAGLDAEISGGYTSDLLSDVCLLYTSDAADE